MEAARHACSDEDLFLVTTDCICLNTETEFKVTEAIKALHHLLKKRSDEIHADGALTPGEHPRHCCCVVDYLGRFSYGLKPSEARYIVYRYLKMNHMNIPKSLKYLMLTAEFRRAQNLDKTALFPSLIPVSGFDQRLLCEELRLPYITNVATGRRYVDVDGRLKIDVEEFDYYNVRYDEMYGDGVFSRLPHTSPRLQDDKHEGLLPEETNAVAAENEPVKADEIPESILSTGGEGHTNRQLTKEAAPALPSSAQELAETERATREATTTDSNEKGILHSLLSFLPFQRNNGTNGSGERGSDDLQMKHDKSGMQGESRAHLHTTHPSSTDSSREGGDVDLDGLEVAVRLDRTILVDSAGSPVIVTNNPNTLYADSLNFHGILEPIIAVVTKYVPFAFHYWDREGHPIMYCQLGRLDSKLLKRELFALTPIDAEPSMLALLFNTYALLVLEQLVRYCNRRNQASNDIHDAFLATANGSGSEVQRNEASTSTDPFQRRVLIGSFVVVIDCSGVKMRRYVHRPLLAMVLSTVRINLLHYPELMHHVYVTNCHSIVSWSYLMIRGALTEDTRRKVSFCSKRQTAPMLCAVIDTDLVPKELGGRCLCPGGCIPSLVCAGGTSSSLASCTSHADLLVSSQTPHSECSSERRAQQYDEDASIFRPLHCTVERVVLRARQTRKISFAMDARCEIIWTFAVKQEREVDFSALFVSAGDDGAMFSLVPRRRVTNEAGHYICPSIGTIIFEWSNQHSFFRHCRLSLKVYREEHTLSSV